MRLISSGLVVTSLKPLVVVVGVLRVFLLLGLYHLDRHKFFQECILHVGLHGKFQYPSTNGGNRVMVRILCSGGNFSLFPIL